VTDDARAPISFPARLRELAATRADDPAYTLVSLDGRRDGITYGQLQTWSTAVAHELAARGVTSASTVVIALGNSLEHFATTWAAWRLGAMVLPLSPRLPGPERDAILALAAPTVVVSSWSDLPGMSLAEVSSLRGRPSADLPDVTPHPGKSVGSGGSTGRPKVIVDPAPLAKTVGASLGTPGQAVRFYDASVSLVPGPVFHNMPFTWSAYGVFEGQHVVVLERFDAGLLVDVIEQDRIGFMTVVPTMMRRVAEVPGVRERDFSSLLGVLHSAAPCPEPLKRAWIDLVGAEVLWEGFGATENVGIVLVRGDEWLEHPGTVGRALPGTSLKVLAEDGREVSPGVVGEVFMRVDSDEPTYRYVGADPAPTTPDGYTSVGDLGWVDEEGYLYPADRRVDLIITGGSNVYPAEVEAVLAEHPHVADVAVIGLPDEEWGRRVHAIVQARDGGVDVHDLEALCRASLSPYKVPKSFEVVAQLPRDEAGKLRRRALVDARPTLTGS